MSVFDIKDQVVVITGGTGVLGREIGTYLAHEGARVVLLGRRQDVGEALAEGIRAQGGDAAFYVCDVTDMEMVNGVRDQIVDRYTLSLHDALPISGGCPVECCRRQYAWCHHSPRQDTLRRTGGRVRTCAECESHRYTHPHTSLPETHDRSWARQHSELQQHGSFSSAHTRDGICSSQSWHQQPHRLPGQRGCHQIQSLDTCQCHCPRILPHRPEPRSADQSRRYAHRERSGRNQADALQAIRQAGRTLWHHPVPHQSGVHLRHRYRGCSGRRIQHIRHLMAVNGKREPYQESEREKVYTTDLLYNDSIR